jgi:hydrogenase nickel incorporation protein HypB
MGGSSVSINGASADPTAPIHGASVTDEANSHDAVDAASRLVTLEQDLLAKNAGFAQANRRLFNELGVFVINLVSSPGSGKTTLLARTADDLGKRIPLSVIEGDQHTSRDAMRIRATGVPAIQINTGKICHLDAHMIGHAVERLELGRGGVLFIENVARPASTSANITRSLSCP